MAEFSPYSRQPVHFAPGDDEDGSDVHVLANATAGQAAAAKPAAFLFVNDEYEAFSNPRPTSTMVIDSELSKKPSKIVQKDEEYVAAPVRMDLFPTVPGASKPTRDTAASVTSAKSMVSSTEDIYTPAPSFPGHATAVAKPTTVVSPPQPVSNVYAPAQSHLQRKPVQQGEQYAPVSARRPEPGVLYFENFTRNMAVEKLKPLPAGSFLVRKSKNNCYVISYNESGPNGTVQHIKFYPVGDQWTDDRGQQKFNTVKEFLRNLTFNLLVDANPAAMGKAYPQSSTLTSASSSSAAAAASVPQLQQPQSDKLTALLHSSPVPVNNDTKSQHSTASPITVTSNAPKITSRSKPTAPPPPSTRQRPTSPPPSSPSSPPPSSPPTVQESKPPPPVARPPTVDESKPPPPVARPPVSWSPPENSSSSEYGNLVLTYDIVAVKKKSRPPATVAPLQPSAGKPPPRAPPLSPPVVVDSIVSAPPSDVQTPPAPPAIVDTTNFIVDPDSFRIDSAIPVSAGKKGKTFTSYSVSFTLNPDNGDSSALTSSSSCSSTVLKRYSEFDSLFGSLASLVRADALPKLPPKRLFKNTDAEFIENRRIHLELWLKKIASMPSVAHHPCFAEFLGIQKPLTWKAGTGASVETTSAPSLATPSPPPPTPAPPPPAPLTAIAALTSPPPLKSEAALPPPPSQVPSSLPPPSSPPIASNTQQSDSKPAMNIVHRSRARSRSVGSITLPRNFSLAGQKPSAVGISSSLATAPPPTPLSSATVRGGTVRLPPPIVKRSLSSGSLKKNGAGQSAAPAKPPRPSVQYSALPTDAARPAKAGPYVEASLMTGPAPPPLTRQLCKRCGEKASARIDEAKGVIWLCRACALEFIEEGRRAGRSITAINPPSKPKRAK